MPVLLRPVDAMTRRVGGPPDPADADPAAIAPPTDDELIAAWEGGRDGKTFADAIPRRFRPLLERDLFFRASELERLTAAFEIGEAAARKAEWDRLAAAKRGNGRKPK